jgi:hypothetical protein
LLVLCSTWPWSWLSWLVWDWRRKASQSKS